MRHASRCYCLSGSASLGMIAEFFKLCPDDSLGTPVCICPFVQQNSLVTTSRWSASSAQTAAPVFHNTKTLHEIHKHLPGSEGGWFKEHWSSLCTDTPKAWSLYHIDQNWDEHTYKPIVAHSWPSKTPLFPFRTRQNFPGPLGPCFCSVTTSPAEPLDATASVVEATVLLTHSNPRKRTQIKLTYIAPARPREL